MVTVAATGDKVGRFDTVTARHIFVKNDAGKIVVTLGANDGGDGLVTTHQPNGKDLVDLTASDNGGMIRVFNKEGEEVVQLLADENGEGNVGWKSE